MMFKKLICVLLSVSILWISSCDIILADNIYVRGDIDNNGVFNVIDLVLLKKYLLNATAIELYPADMNVDDVVDLRDLIRMKKYFAGDVLHKNSTDVGMSWTIMDGDSTFPIISAVGFRIYTNCYTRTSCLPDRYVTEISSYISTGRNPNPELDDPELYISTTTINENIIDMVNNNSNIVPADTIFTSKISYSQINVPERSTYECLFIVMLSDKTVNPYRETKNIFEF